MNAEILESTSSPPNREVNYTMPAPSSSPPVRHWRTSIALSLGVLVLLASFVIAAINLRSHASPSATPSTAATPDKNGPWYALGYVDIKGGVTSLYPVQMGRVKRILAEENEIVEEGKPLLELDDSFARFKVREAESDLEGARKQLAIAQVGEEEAGKQIAAQNTAIAAARKKVEMARILRDKQQRFEKDEIGDKESLQAAKIAVEQAELGVKGEQEKLAVLEVIRRKAEGLVEAAKVAIKGKQAQLDEARHAVYECILRAPAKGVPLRILVNVGETLGANPRQPAIQFAAEGPLLVRAEVEQEFVSRVKPSQEVIIEDSVTEKAFASGVVVHIARWYASHRNMNAEILTTTNDTRNVECIIHIKSPTPDIRIGQRVRIKFDD